MNEREILERLSLIIHKDANAYRAMKERFDGVFVCDGCGAEGVYNVMDSLCACPDCVGRIAEALEQKAKEVKG